MPLYVKMSKHAFVHLPKIRKPLSSSRIGILPKGWRAIFSGVCEIEEISHQKLKGYRKHIVKSTHLLFTLQDIDVYKFKRDTLLLQSHNNFLGASRDTHTIELENHFFFENRRDCEEVMVMSTVSHIFIYKYHEFLTSKKVKKKRDLNRSFWPVRELTSHLQSYFTQKSLSCHCCRLSYTSLNKARVHQDTLFLSTFSHDMHGTTYEQAAPPTPGANRNHHIDGMT